MLFITAYLFCNGFQDYKFERISSVLGDVKMTVTQIKAGKQHNAIPAEVELVVDVRVNECYTNEEIVQTLQENTPCSSIIPRSTRLNSSSIPLDHELVKAGIELGRTTLWFTNAFRPSDINMPFFKIRSR